MVEPSVDEGSKENRLSSLADDSGRSEPDSAVKLLAHVIFASPSASVLVLKIVIPVSGVLVPRRRHSSLPDTRFAIDPPTDIGMEWIDLGGSDRCGDFFWSGCGKMAWVLTAC